MSLISVMVPATLIEDGETLPALGQDIVVALRFIELGQSAIGGEDARTMQLRALAEPRGGPFRNRPLGGEEYGDPWWSVLLRGNSWVASWAASRPASGAVTLRGMLVADWDIGVAPEARGRGRVIRVQVVSHTVEYAPVGAPPGTPQEQRVPGTQQLREVTSSPSSFTRGAPGRPGARPHRWTGEDGVLVDVALDAEETGGPRG